MKKFLTVLLALSVVFTYTVGTAFATSSYNDSDKAIAKATSEQEALAKTTADAKASLAYNGYGYLVSINGDPVDGFAVGKITKAAAEAAVDEISNAIHKAIYDKAVEVVTDGTFSDDDEAAVEAARIYKDVDSLLAAAFADNYKVALHKQYAIERDEAEATIAGLDPSKYSNIEYFKLEDGKYVALLYDDRAYENGISEAELAQATKDAANAALSGISLASTANAATAAAAIDDIREAVDELLTPVAAFFNVYADPDHQKFVTDADRKADLDKAELQTINDMKSYAQKFEEAAIEYLQGIIRSSVNQTTVNKAQERLNALSGQVDGLVAAFTSRIDDIKIDEYTTPKDAYEDLAALDSEFKAAFVASDAAQGNFDAFDAAVDRLGGIETLIAYAKEYANVLKTTYADNSTELKYDADAIDVVLDAAMDKIKVGALTSKTQVKNWMDAYADTIAKRALTLAAQRMGTLNYIASVYAESNYDDAAYAALNRWAEMKPIIDKAVAAVNAATTPKAIRDIQDQLDKDLAGYLTDDECEDVVSNWVVNNVVNESSYVGGANLAPTNGKTLAQLIDNDVDAYFVGKTGYKAATIQDIKDNIKFELKVAACSLGKTANEITSNDSVSIYNAMVKVYNTAFAAEVAKAKTDSELSAAEASVKTLIDAIGTPVTLASRAKIEAAQNAYDTYAAMPGADVAKITNKATLDKANDRLKTLEKAQILDSLYKLNNKDITVDDKAALENVIALNDAYVEYWGVASGYENDIEDAWDAYIRAAFQDFINKSGKLPATITTADKAAIDAAQAAYDEVVAQLVAEGYTEEFIEAFLKNTYGTIDGEILWTNILKSKIKLVDSNEQYERAVITEVESLKIKACSSAKKGSITVKWTVTGDASVADGYQVYKSTRAQKGYTFMGKTKKTSMVNKKNLKKGTRYYYKVRAYVDIDGVRYCSDWSNKANRIAK